MISNLNIFCTLCRRKAALDGKTPAEIEKAMENKAPERIIAKEERDSKTKVDYWI